VIAGPEGQILLTNEAFERLLQAGHPHLHWLDDLPGLFVEPAEIRRNLREVLAQRQTWRGEAFLVNKLGEATPLSVRADPVLAPPGRVLGFVLLLNDLTERKAAESARRRFQEGLVEQNRTMHERLGSKANLQYFNLLSSVVGNAQLAALEITDGVDVGQMPELLESVQTSVSRTAELLEHLIRHASRERDLDA
jgi:two-component system, chemotaxis family, sensor kinase Cph1